MARQSCLAAFSLAATEVRGQARLMTRRMRCYGKYILQQDNDCLKNVSKKRNFFKKLLHIDSKLQFSFNQGTIQCVYCHALRKINMLRLPLIAVLIFISAAPRCKCNRLDSCLRHHKTGQTNCFQCRNVLRNCDAWERFISPQKVCGSDGVTYNSRCDLVRYMCAQETFISLVKNGPCD